MLVLSRKAQQSIRIGDSVTVTILKVKGNSVRIGIEAPPTTNIKREELLARVAKENKRAHAGEAKSWVDSSPRRGGNRQTPPDLIRCSQALLRTLGVAHTDVVCTALNVARAAGYRAAQVGLAPNNADAGSWAADHAVSVTCHVTASRAGTTHRAVLTHRNEAWP